MRRLITNPFLLLAIVGCSFCITTRSLGQTYPTKPIRVLVGFGPGGGADTSARIIAPKLAESLGTPVVVENRPGASTAIATERVARSPADGYTLLLLPSSTTILSALRSALPYDLERDFTPLSLLTVGQFVLVVHPSVPARDIAHLLDLARVQPGRLTYGSSGPGSASHLAAELFNSMTKVKLLHVPYKGANDAAIATASGEIDMFFATVAPMLPLRAAGKIRALAVSGARRTPLLPTMPTISESGVPGYERYVWYGLIGPAGLPKDIVLQLHGAIEKVGSTAEMSKIYAKQGLEPKTNSPEQFAAFIKNDIKQSAGLISLSGATSQ
jgi:tripartite-type tricarboxylate transporter receptor subunit TctC